MIYFDNAATSYPKPRAVINGMVDAVVKYGGNPGRSSHALSREASRLIYECREEVASLFDGQAENVVFTYNATYALNLAINALRPKGGRALISSLEHNAVWRPISSGGEYDIFDCSGSDGDIIKSFTEKLKDHPRIVVCNQMSNLNGRLLPINEIGRLCGIMGIPFIVDASQGAGRVRLSIKECRADAICAPSHKGLWGIQGGGFALFADKYTDGVSLKPFVFGGNGINSLESTMPDFLPERFEGGTPSTPAIASLLHGIREVKRIGIDLISYREERLGKRLVEGLSVIKGAEVYGNAPPSGNVVFNMKGIPSERLCSELDKLGFCLRGGYHCCPLGHKTLKTPQGGAARASFSLYNYSAEVDKLLSVLNEISRQI